MTLDRDRVLRAVEQRSRDLPGVIDFHYLDTEFKETLIALERSAEENGACGGLMPFVNTGVWKALDRKHGFVLVVNSSMMILSPTRDVVYIADQDGQIVGEYLTPSRRGEIKDRDDVCFLSEDFIFYLNVVPKGEPYFVLPPIPFQFLDDISGVKDVTSGSISTLADDMVRERLGYSQTKHWTHLVGFNIEGED